MDGGKTGDTLLGLEQRQALKMSVKADGTR
jgi:hypothetical protein